MDYELLTGRIRNLECKSCGKKYEKHVMDFSDKCNECEPVIKINEDYVEE